MLYPYVSSMTVLMQDTDDDFHSLTESVCDRSIEGDGDDGKLIDKQTANGKLIGDQSANGKPVPSAPDFHGYDMQNAILKGLHLERLLTKQIETSALSVNLVEAEGAEGGQRSPSRSSSFWNHWKKILFFSVFVLSILKSIFIQIKFM